MDEEVSRLSMRVAELEKRLDFLYQKLTVEYVAPPSQDDPRIVEMIRKNNLIEAIKIYREMHNVGLYEAKKEVEAIAARVSGR